MIADTSIWVDHFLGKSGADLEHFKNALHEGRIVMAPVVLAELLSSKKMPSIVESLLLEVPFATPGPNFWKKAGLLRRLLAKQGINASLADCLIAQSCLEKNLPLLTRDKTIKKFAHKIELLLA